MSMVIELLKIVGLVSLAIAWGKIFLIGLRMLLPFNLDMKKNKGYNCFSAFIICVISFFPMSISGIGAIVLILGILFM